MLRFGSQQTSNIQKAINKTLGQGPEAAIEIMFELVNEDSSSEEQNRSSFADLAGNLQGAVSVYEVPSKEIQPEVFLPKNYDKVINLIDMGYKVLIILRGLPGSGKSFLGKQIVDKFGMNARNHVFSADDYFYDVNRKYVYDAGRLSEAHDFNQNRVMKKMREGWSPVIVDNTNLKQWEMFPYIKFAVKYHYLIEILEPTTPWARNAKQLEDRNQHKVPKDKIIKMIDNYENTNVRKLLQIIDYESHISLQPAIRNYPPFSNVLQDNKNKDMLPELQDNGKPQRELFEGKKSNWQPSSSQLDGSNVNWLTFEEDNFWNKYNKESNKILPEQKKILEPINNVPKPPRDVLKTLKEATSKHSEATPQNNKSKVQRSICQDEPTIPEKHKKNCPKENVTFREIRQMFPTIGIGQLWDLFEKCGGSGDWVTDLLIQDEASLNYEVDDSADFNCECDKPGTLNKIIVLQLS